MRLCPWADVVYGCDGPWWRARKGLPDFAGIKLAHDSSVCAAFKDVHKIEVADDDRLRFDVPGLVGSGGNSGFQALNLAVQFGARRVLLIGFDMHVGDGVHWYGRNTWSGANNPGMKHLMRWRDAFTTQAAKLQRMGVEVINASPDSALRCFEIASIETAMQRWSL
ncbi:hypothetical protein [Bradyrhizobium sp. I71]|uniref:hypothetical protein n=1 Tax=Bradyrhizobium sp. I71 TaxID=2590772 RepID=UPI001EF798AC|nr:hypothetical protein [Bradyrhizobium sp. I71]ULK98854.1 hypothetical protein FJV43_03665 [Bradyrhizobium sp. I71]